MSLVQMSITGSLFILFIVVVRALAIHHLSKATFSILWGIAAWRLLFPFSIPSPFSINTYTEKMVNLVERNAADIAFLPLEQQVISVAANASFASHAAVTPPIFTVIWLIGVGLMVVYFLVSYLKAIRKFSQSLPSNSLFAEKWLENHQTTRTIKIKVSDRITSPITYGIFRPVILLPKKMDHEDHALMTCILTHEYMHIRRFDIIAKFVLALVLCIHWFNPLVWVMYILANRDIELSCDECVIRTLGEKKKAAYALALINMEEIKSRSSSLVSYFSRYAIKERTLAIMKYKKQSAFTIALAIILLVGATAIFATSSTVAAGLNTQSADLAFDPAPMNCDSIDGLNDWLIALQAEAERLVGENKLMQEQADEILLFYQKQVADLSAAVAAGYMITLDKTDGSSGQIFYTMDQLSYVPPTIHHVFENYIHEESLSDISLSLPAEKGALFCMALQNGRE